MVSRNLGFRFTLVSYNILSQTLLNDHGYLYTSCNPKDLEWPKRGHRILSELLHKQADIICLQEVESEHLQSLYRPKLARCGYQCLYKKKTGYKIDGCAIFFKSKLFQLMSYKGIEFNRTDMANLLNRDNVGIIAVLKPKFSCETDNSRLVIANTHLIFNPKRSDIKLAQLKLFLSELDEISFEHYDTINDERCHYPTILCGDLNSVPESDVNRYIVKNQTSFERQDKVDKESDISPAKPQENQEEKQIEETGREEEDNNLSRLSHTFRFKSVYPVKNRAGQPYVSTFSNHIVDYIFYTPRIYLESYRELLTEDELRELGPIPNSEFPSDHLTLEAQFRLKYSNQK